MTRRLAANMARTNPCKQMYKDNAKHKAVGVNDEFVLACENGDYSTVRRIIQENPKFSIDVANQLGRTAIQLAVENEHLEVVTLLLAQCDGQKMREALLLAIYLDHVQIAQACLNHPKFKVFNERRVFTGSEDSFWQTPSSDDAQFAPDITPLMLASQYNRTEIVQILLRGGDRITKPHDYHCKCLECHHKFKFDSLRHAQSRLNAYRGLASESYISLASVDPILTAFELGHELRDLSGKEKYFKNEYIILADQLSAYAVKLLDKVRGQTELDCLLGKTGKESEEKFVVLARLYLAIQYEEKRFVAHSNCQQKLVEIWHSQIRNIFKLNSLILLLLIVLYIFLLPFASVFYILTSWSKHTIKFQRFFKQPCIKFIGRTISYGVFIALIIVSSLLSAEEFQKPLKHLRDHYPEVADALNQSLEYRETNNQVDCVIYPNDDLVFRFDRPTSIDIAISVFVIGFLWHETKQAFKDGFRDYLLSWNNIVDSCMNVLYLSSFALKYYVIARVVQASNQLREPEFLSNVGTICNLTESEQNNIYQTFYWLNADRFYWVSLDPVNVAEGLFAIANIFSFSRICFLLPAFQHLGPLQISLGRMMADIGKFIIIFLIIFFGFVFGLNNLFWYYKGSVRDKVEVTPHPEDDELPAEKFFGTMSATFKTVFWSLFGLAEKNGVQLEDFDKEFTEIVGYLIYGAFNIASVIVLLNMLIAMMSKSYESIEEHADIEWKFARSKLYMEYIKEGGTLPIPFNIIPTVKDVCHLFRRLCSCVRRLGRSSHTQGDASETSTSGASTMRPSAMDMRTGMTNIDGRLAIVSNERHINRNSDISTYYRARQRSFDASQTLTYSKLINRIIKRFLLHKKREEQEEIREGDFEELKQDIQMLRFEVLNRLDVVRDDLSVHGQLLNEGVVLVGDLLTSSTGESHEKFQYFRSNLGSRSDSGCEVATLSSSISTMSMSNANRSSQSSRSVSFASLSNQDESDVNPVKVLKHLSALNVTLSDIKEEEEHLHHSLRFIDDDDDDDDEIEDQPIRRDNDDQTLSRY